MLTHNEAMRTTVDLDEAMLDRAKHLALREGKTLSAVVSDALAAYLGARKQAQKAAPFELLVRGNARGRFPLNRIAIEIEAALAFGTGHHGTTRGCLLALAAILKARRVRNVLDVGTGTGVLAIATSLALREKVLATDIDALAVRIARDNARRNRAQVEAIHAPGVRSQRVRARAPYDLIFANILLGPLKILAAPVSCLLAPGGRIVLSGLLAAHANAAISAYRACGLVLESRLALEGWVTLVMRRPAKRQRPGRYPGRR